MVIFSLPIASVGLGIVIAASVPILRDTYGASDIQVGAILALDALGIAIGTALPARYAGYLAGLALLAIGWGGFGLAPDVWRAGALSMVGGIGNGIVIVRFRTMMQRETPPHERASTIGFAYAVTFSMVVVGQVAVVPLVSLLGQRATFTLAGTVFAVGGLVAALCWPRAVKVPEPSLLEAARRLPRPRTIIMIMSSRGKRGSDSPVLLTGSGHALGVRLGEALARGRVLGQHRRRADRAADELAAAVRADAGEAALGAVRAERALVGADARLGGLGRQVAVTAFAVRS